MAKVETPCLLWTGAKTSSGYGHRRFSGRLWLVHRLAWTLEHGEIPEGMLVCHRCDVRTCYRLDHLFLGTHQDNTRDMIRKGRYGQRAQGSWSSRAKLSAELAEEIRTMYASGGHSCSTLAVMYGTAPATIHGVVNGCAWNLDKERRQKLSLEQARLIVRQIKDGVRGVDIAAEFSVTQSLISLIRRRRAWATAWEAESEEICGDLK